MKEFKVGDDVELLQGRSNKKWDKQWLLPIKRKQHTKLREKLIISIAGGPMAATYNIYDVDLNAKQIVRFADAIIKQLEDE